MITAHPYVLRGKIGRSFPISRAFHALLPPPALRECRHRGLARILRKTEVAGKLGVGGDNLDLDKNLGPDELGNYEQHRSWSIKSPKLFTLAALYDANRELLKGRENDDVIENANVLKDYWGEVASHMPD
jgi:hypothetical protein